MYTYSIFDMPFIINRIFYAHKAAGKLNKHDLFKTTLKSTKNIITNFGTKENHFCFDSNSNFRKDLYPEYKANRAEKDQILKDVLFEIYDFMSEGLGLKCYKIENFESDDIIASIKFQYMQNKKGIIISGDKDLMKLIDDNCYSIIGVGQKKFDLVKPEDVFEKFGVMPEKISDFLALVGDSADNFPGVSGVGETKAINLLEKYINYQGIVNNLENIKDKKVLKGFSDLPDKYLPLKLANLVYDIDLSKSYKRKNDDKKQMYINKYNLMYH